MLHCCCMVALAGLEVELACSLMLACLLQIMMGLGVVWKAGGPTAGMGWDWLDNMIRLGGVR